MKVKFGNQILSNYRGNLTISATNTNVIVKDIDGNTIEPKNRVVSVGQYVIEATPEEGTELQSLTVNGNSINSGDSFNLNFGENLLIYAESMGISETSASLFKFNGSAITGYIGTEKDIVLPTSYSLGDEVVKTETISGSVWDYFSLFESIGYVFKFTSGNTIIEVVNEDDYWNKQSDIDNALLENETGTIEYTAVEILDGDDYLVDSIADNAFSFNDIIESVHVPSSIKTIGNSAFNGCYNLKKIGLSYGVETINAYAFSSTGLTEIEIPESVEEIPDGLFHICSSLSKVKLPSSLKTMNTNSTFGLCTSLKSIFIPASVSLYSPDPSSGYSNLFTDCSEDLVIYCEAEEPNESFYEGWNTYRSFVDDSVITFAVQWGVSAEEYEEIVSGII